MTSSQLKPKIAIIGGGAGISLAYQLQGAFDIEIFEPLLHAVDVLPIVIFLVII